MEVRPLLQTNLMTEPRVSYRPPFRRRAVNFKQNPFSSHSRRQLLRLNNTRRAASVPQEMLSQRLKLRLPQKPHLSQASNSARTCQSLAKRPFLLVGRRALACFVSGLPFWMVRKLIMALLRLSAECEGYHTPQRRHRVGSHSSTADPA
jgi:hypothetical protein